MGSFILLGSILIFVLIFRFLPIIIQVDGYFDVNSGKIGCLVRLYGKIKLVGGYLAPCPSGFAFHISEKKAILFSYKQIDNERKNISAKSGSEIKSLAIVAEIGPEYLLPIYFLENFFKTKLLLTGEEKLLQSKIILTGNDVFRVFVKARIKINLFNKLLQLSKYLFGRITKVCRKIKSAT